MKLLIYGAGVIECLYAAAFSKVGYDTDVYARGKNSTVNKATLFGCRSYTFDFYKSPIPPIHYHNGKYKRQQIRGGL